MKAPELLSGQDILILSPSEWRDNAVSNMQIAALLSDRNKVVYVETMGSRMPRLSELGRVWERLKRIVGGATARGGHRGLDPRRVTILSPFAVPLHGNRVVDWFNQRILVFQVKRLMRRLGMRRPIIWSFSPRWEPVVEDLERRCLIFHCVDALHTYDASPVFRARFERTVCRADMVFTPGVLLEQELHRLNPATHRIGHGCGSDHLDYRDDGGIPADLRSTPEPRVIYAGTLANWVDYRLLTDVAGCLPEISFLLVGYVHALAPREDVRLLRSLPNVHHLGYKDFADLPLYYRCSAVGIVPYQADNEHILYSSPTKFLDYVAAGLPVVSTRFPAAETMQPMVYCADTAEEFAAAIEKAIADNSPGRAAQRRAYASAHTWERQVAKMCGHIRRHLNGG
ncbi:MAG: glycosyltransferase [Proteobacteria bacterium]|nr:MAG: glycosyltransferase [Pseudomonadota bacterium]